MSDDPALPPQGSLERVKDMPSGQDDHSPVSQGLQEPKGIPPLAHPPVWPQTRHTGPSRKT